MKPEQIEELREIAEEIKNIDYCYGSGLLIPQATKVNSSRAAMTFQQVNQAKNLIEPELPRVGTGYEKLFSDRSISYDKSDREYEVVKKIRKFEDSDIYYALILREVGTHYYHIVYRHEVESFAETSGVKINNEYMDSKNVGDKIHNGDVIYRSNSYDENMNYRYGINAKTLYLVNPPNVEDGQVIAESLAKRLSTVSVSEHTFSKNSNEVLINCYGNSKFFKVFPDIGEEVKNGALCIKRRIDYNNAQYILKNRNLRKEMHGDKVQYAHGTVVDINIYSNISIDDIPDDPANEQIKKYLGSITNYYREIYEFMLTIKENPKTTYSDELGMIYARSRDILSIGKRIIWNNDASLFDSMIISITTLDITPARIGSKLVGRHGNKGVIAEILPDDQMPTDEDGNHSELIYDALGVIGRLNISQNGEHELNWIMDNIIQSDKSDKAKFNCVLDLLSLVNPDQEMKMRDFYNDLSESDKKEYIKEVATEGVSIMQPPSQTASFDNYAKAVEKLKPKKKKFTVKDEDGKVYNIQNKLIMADSYVLRLKHEPKTKFSVRNKGTINPRTFLPIKSQAYSKGTAMFNNQAVRIGNMEMDILYLCNDPAAINYMIRMYCTSVVGRRQIGEILNKNIFNEALQLDMPDSRSRLVTMFNATFMTCGLGLDISLSGDMEEIEEDCVVEDIMDMKPKQVKLIFKDDMKNLFYNE